MDLGIFILANERKCVEELKFPGSRRYIEGHISPTLLAVVIFSMKNVRLGYSIGYAKALFLNSSDIANTVACQKRLNSGKGGC